MAKLEIADQEMHLILEGLSKQEASARRSYNTVKDPIIRDCYDKQVVAIKNLTHRLTTTKQ